MRTKNSLRNLITAFIGQFIGIVVTFILRKTFILYLSNEYLGIDGLFTNIITLLSLVELGIGPAMTYALYKPIVENDRETIKSLMFLYKKAYRIIGIIVIIIGILLLPIYRFLIDKVPNIDNLNIIFMLFVINTGVSYFFSYKRGLIISNEKKYITTLIKYSCYIVLSLIQLVILFITKNYILYLILQIIFTLVENIITSIICNKMYPFIKEKNIKKIDSNINKSIKKNVMAMLFHKIGGIVVNSTDNIIISKYVGIISVGLYSNYYLILNALTTITNQFFEAIVASIGKIGATNNINKLNKIFNNSFLFNYWLFALISCILSTIFNDFIYLWIGKNFVFNKIIVYIIIFNFYLRGIRKSCLTFRDALGLFWYDRYKPLIESIINLVVSLFLVKSYGVLGVFVGTTISTLTTSIWIEPYVLYKYGFYKNTKEYYKKLFVYTILGILITFICIKITNLINTINIINIFIKIFISFSIFNIINILVFHKSDEFIYFKNLLLTLFHKKHTKN